MPDAASAGLEVLATIDTGKLDNVLYVGRPVHGGSNTGLPLFKILNNGTGAIGIYVQFGRASVSTVEVLAGLTEGDKVILSDMSSVESAERVRLTDENTSLAIDA